MKILNIKSQSHIQRFMMNRIRCSIYRSNSALQDNLH